MRECRALGASELEYDYRLTALRMIATDSIRDKMDFEDAKLDDSTDKEEKYKIQLDTLMRWAHQKMVSAKDKAKSSTKMDVGGVSGSPEWTHEQQYQHDMSINMMKGGYKGGKGKGYYPKGGFGKGKGGYTPGWNPGYSPKGGGKGYTPYQPKGKGKGMQGQCFNCGETGHPARLCTSPPQGRGKGKGGIQGAFFTCGRACAG